MRRFKRWFISWVLYVPTGSQRRILNRLAMSLAFCALWLLLIFGLGLLWRVIE